MDSYCKPVCLIQFNNHTISSKTTHQFSVQNAKLGEQVTAPLVQ